MRSSTSTITPAEMRCFMAAADADSPPRRDTNSVSPHGGGPSIRCAWPCRVAHFSLLPPTPMHGPLALQRNDHDQQRRENRSVKQEAQHGLFGSEIRDARVEQADIANEHQPALP